jgi:hypothetical protein
MRSPLVAACVSAGLFPVCAFVGFTLLSPLISMMSSGQPFSDAFASAPIGLLIAGGLLVGLQFLLMIHCGILVVHQSAEAWHSEVQGETREQIAVTRLSAAHLVGSKTLLWMVPPLVANASNTLVRSVGFSLMFALGVDRWDSVFGMGMVNMFKSAGPEFAALFILVTVPLGVLYSLGAWLAALGLTALIACSGIRPLPTVLLVGLGWFALSSATGLLSIPLAMLFGFLSAALGEVSDATQSLAVLVYTTFIMLISLSIVWLAVWLLWRWLPGHVGRIHGLTR